MVIFRQGLMKLRLVSNLLPTATVTFNSWSSCLYLPTARIIPWTTTIVCSFYLGKGCSWDRVLPHGTSWTQTHGRASATASRALGSHVCTTTTIQRTEEPWLASNSRGPSRIKGTHHHSKARSNTGKNHHFLWWEKPCLPAIAHVSSTNGSGVTARPRNSKLERQCCLVAQEEKASVLLWNGTLVSPQRTNMQQEAWPVLQHLHSAHSPWHHKISK